MHIIPLKIIKQEQKIPCLDFSQVVQLHYSTPTASQLILENCGIKTLLNKNAEAKVITASDEKQRQTFIAKNIIRPCCTR